MRQVIRPIKGTRDFYPEDMAIHQWLEGAIQQTSRSFGYEAWDGPFLESLELYAAKSGEELVMEQAFCFKDRGGDLITLRPELTPTLARMVAQKQQQLVMPLRWYSFGPFWRYERPQRGRTREFYQWNIDMVDVSGPAADAELIAVCAAFFRNVGLQPEMVKIRVNDRQLMNQQLDALNILPEKHGQVFKLIDRKPKMDAVDWEKFVIDSGFSREQSQGLLGLLHNTELWTESPHLSEVLGILNAMGVSDYIVYDSAVIRGLDYYTGVVFEAVDVSGGRAILGGGHYDNLVSDVGGTPMAGVGFAMGDVMIKIVLGDYGLLPSPAVLNNAVLVCVFDEATISDAFSLGSTLRANGINTVVYPEPAKLVKQFKYADRKNINTVVLRGPDEIANGQLTIKNLGTREQTAYPFAEGISEIKKLLA
ncbi:MAG: histidine--tRNA ligase [Anaerolineae bacterium]|nr:histidine--tRNA ligase [Anaerolineae bacterium]